MCFYLAASLVYKPPPEEGQDESFTTIGKDTISPDNNGKDNIAFIADNSHPINGVGKDNIDFTADNSQPINDVDNHKENGFMICYDPEPDTTNVSSPGVQTQNTKHNGINTHIVTNGINGTSDASLNTKM